MNTLWCVLMKDIIWHKVIKEKYLPFSLVVAWLRMTNTRTQNASLTWRNLVKSLDLITDWLSWSPGSEHSIIVGKDELLGLGINLILSFELVNSLQQRNIYFLFQAPGGNLVKSSDSLEFRQLNGAFIARLFYPRVFS